MLLPLKVLAPAEVVEHMPGWSIVSISLGIEQDSEQQNKENGYAVSVAVLVNPALAAALESQTVENAGELARQVLDATNKAVGGFLGAEPE